MILIVLAYFLICALQILGIGFHVMQKIVELGNKYPDKDRREIKEIFKKEDWDTTAISGLVLILHLIVHFIADIYAVELRDSIPYFILWSFAFALVLGYAGQRLIYKAFGTAEKVLGKKLDNQI